VLREDLRESRIRLGSCGFSVVNLGTKNEQMMFQLSNRSLLDGGHNVYQL